MQKEVRKIPINHKDMLIYKWVPTSEKIYQSLPKILYFLFGF